MIIPTMVKESRNVTNKNGNSGTPLMRQYGEIKSKYPDSIVLFRMGDFSEDSVCVFRTVEI